MIVQFLESFANKRISSSEDRYEETKRRKLAVKAQKLIELMMVSGIPTASGYEERIRFSEMEVVDRGANEQGLVVNAPHGHEINGWDVNVAAVRVVREKRHVRSHSHAVSYLRSATLVRLRTNRIHRNFYCASRRRDRQRFTSADDIVISSSSTNDYDSSFQARS